MMSEDTAKTKWCPFVRYGEQASNRDNAYMGDDNFIGTRCIGSACMAWRWSEFETKTGYCGMAGQQQE